MLFLDFDLDLSTLIFLLDLKLWSVTLTDFLDLAETLLFLEELLLSLDLDFCDFLDFTETFLLLLDDDLLLLDDEFLELDRLLFLD